MPTPKKSSQGKRRPRRPKKAADGGLHCEAAGPQTGDALRIIINCGPSGEPIIDTMLTDSHNAPKIDRTRSPVAKTILEHRRKQFEERVLPIALLARRYVIDAKFVAEHGSEADMRRAILLMTKGLDGLVDSILRVCSEITLP